MATCQAGPVCDRGHPILRGCPFDCDFCNVTATLGREPRVKDASQIIRELDDLHHAGWRERVFFVDDNLIGNKPLCARSFFRR